MNVVTQILDWFVGIRFVLKLQGVAVNQSIANYG